MSFVLVQWARLHPRGWESVPVGQWHALARRPVPVGGEVLDDSPGWVNRVCVQGVNGAADHYHVQTLPRRGLRLTLWYDDPDDYPPEMWFAQVRDFWPPERVTSDAPGAEMHGSRWNTVQPTPIFYCGDKIGEMFARENADRDLRPWDEFVPPADAHHGIWLPQDLHEEHERLIGAHPAQTNAERVERLRGWMDWIE